MSAPVSSPLVDRLIQGLPRSHISVLRRQARVFGTFDPSAAAVVYPLVGAAAPSQDAGMLVACGWALWHHRYTGAVNADGVGLGHGLRRLGPEVAGRHLEQLSTSATQTYPIRMLRLLDVLSAQRIALDWRLLHRDVRSWMWGRQQSVLRQWARQLYSPTPTNDREEY